VRLDRAARLAAVLVAASLTVTGCRPTGSYSAGQPQIYVDPSAPCPRSLGTARDVHNPGTGLRSRMVPPDRPSGALVCVYRATMLPGSAWSEPRLRRSVRVAARPAGRLTHDLARVSLRPPHGKLNCGAGPTGSVTVIAFGYGHRPAADLWFSTVGWQTLDNGYVLADDAGNSSFDEDFLKQFEALVP
jgi:hypothetical protein